MGMENLCECLKCFNFFGGYPWQLPKRIHFFHQTLLDSRLIAIEIFYTELSNAHGRNKEGPVVGNRVPQYLLIVRPHLQFKRMVLFPRLLTQNEPLGYAHVHLPE
jgi:hypothetical protein